MALTLDGIAQGYITDRVADMLRSEGFDNVLVQAGETVALAPASAARPWRVGVPGVGDAPPVDVLDLRDAAVATSIGGAQREGGPVQ